MNLKDLSDVVIGSMKVCIDSKFSYDEVDVYMVVDDSCYPVNSAQLRFSSDFKESGILILDNAD